MLRSEQIHRIFNAKEEPNTEISGSYNAAPTRFYQVATSTTNCTVQIEAMKWGILIPNSTDLVINGRLEELT